jgi:hypothetical protein
VSGLTHWIFMILGSRDESGAWYGFWSGIGGSIPDVLILTAIGGWYWHRTCHVQRCWRIGRHQVNGTPYVVCRKHHPDIPAVISAAHVAGASAREDTPA